MTAPVSLLPVSASVDMATGTSLPATDNAANGGANPFTQLLQGIVATQTGKGQQQELPFMLELSVNGELDSEGSLLPAQGQSIALSELINPFMGFSAVEGQQQASLNLSLPEGISVLDNKSAATLPGYLAALTARQTTNPALFAAGQDAVSAQALKGTEPDPVIVPELVSQQKLEQFIGTNHKMVTMLEQQLAAKADNHSSLSSLTSNQTFSATGLAAVAPSSARVDVAGTPPPITVPPQNPAWTQQVGERMQWMINQKMQKVEIRLDPPELGSMEVRIVVQKDQAQVTFAAPSAQVRDALEAALPRLREMLSEQGLNLADVDVGQHSLGQQKRESGAEDIAENDKQDSSSVSATAEQSEQDGAGVVSSSNGILDAYV